MSENFKNSPENGGREEQYVDNSNNLYERQYQKEQEQLEQLESGAPQLIPAVDREINKKAMAFIVLAGFALTGLGAFVYHQLTDEGVPDNTERAQVVTVPDLPQPDPVVSEENAIGLAEKQKTTQIPSENIVIPTTNQEEKNNIIGIESSSPPLPTQVMSPAMPIQNIPIGTSAESAIGDSSTFVQDGDLPKGGDTAIPTANAVRLIHNKDKLLLQGTYLRCVLETKIVSEVPGFTSCILTEPVYSASGKYVLLQKGSKVMGQYGSVNPTSGRLGVIWERIVTPDGIDVTLKSPGVDNLGAAGHEGQFSTHWPSRLASALLISMISDTFKYAAAEYGPSGTTVTTSSSTVSNPYESETAETLKQLAISQLERNNSRPNTVTINQGSLINIYTAQDIDFSSAIH